MEEITSLKESNGEYLKQLLNTLTQDNDEQEIAHFNQMCNYINNIIQLLD